MKTDIRSQSFTITDAMRSFIQQRVRQAFGHFAEHIDRVEVRLTDINGPRGGIDKACRIVVRGPGLSLVVNDQDADAYDAAARVLHRAGHALTRRVKRRPPRPALAMAAV